MGMQWLHFPISVKWYITSKCNLRCSHCYLTSYGHESDLDDCIQIIDFLSKKNIAGIYLLGGEPLVRKDICQIVNEISKRGMYVSLATNGTLVNERLAEQLKVSGINNIQISLESSIPIKNDLVRGQGVFNKALKAIQILNAKSIQNTLAITIKKNNIDEIPAILHFCEANNIQNLRLMPFAPVGTGAHHSDEFSLTTSDFFLARDIILKHSNDLSINIDSDFSKTQDNNHCSGCNKSPFGCGAGTTDIVINSDLSLSACDLLTETERTNRIEKPEDIEKLWIEHPMFLNWRNKKMQSNLTICEILNQSLAR